MEGLDRRTVKAQSGVNYAYYTSTPKVGEPTLLLLHGCPDSASLWSDLIQDFLLPNGYGLIVPDLIGYGDTDKPDDVSLYGAASMTEDLASILDAESVSRVIVAGHDFGAFLASKFYSFQSSRVSGLVTFGSCFVPPSPEPFDFDKIKAMMEQYQGYCSIWYTPLFTRERTNEADAGYEVMDQHVENMFTALHGGGERMKDVCCNEGAFEKWLKDDSNRKKPALPYASNSEFRKDWIDRLQRNGLRGPMLWYKAVWKALYAEADLAALQAGTHTVNVPYLFIAASNDPLAPPAAVQGLKAQGLLPDVTTKEVEASHWLMYEKSKDTGEALVDWLKDRF